MAERKAFLAHPKHQYHVAKRGELDCHAHNEKNVDFYEYQSFDPFHI